MQFPDDQTLIARGKYSTLSAERKAQLKRVQDICRTIQGEVIHVLRDCEDTPPADGSHLKTLEICLANLQKARDRITEVSNEMNQIKPDAWGGE